VQFKAIVFITVFMLMGVLSCSSDNPTVTEKSSFNTKFDEAKFDDPEAKIN
jgi:hypothetical protein